METNEIKAYSTNRMLVKAMPQNRNGTHTLWQPVVSVPEGQTAPVLEWLPAERDPADVAIRNDYEMLDVLDENGVDQTESRLMDLIAGWLGELRYGGYVELLWTGQRLHGRVYVPAALRARVSA